MTPPAASLLEAPPKAEAAATPRPPTADTPTPAETPRPEPTSRPDRPRDQGARRAARRLWTSFKLLVLLALLGAVIVAAIVGWPYVRDRLYADVDANAVRIETLDAQLTDADATIAELRAELDRLAERQDQVPSRLDDLAAGQAALDDGQATATSEIAALDARSSALEDRAVALDGRVDDADAAAAALAGEVRNQLELARATELMSRARLFLYQANYGLALDDLEAAQAIVVGLDPAAGGISPAVHAAVTDRLAMVIGSLPDRPVLAADDLDIAWQMLVAEPTSPLVASQPPVPVVVPDDAEAATAGEPADGAPEDGSGG